MISDDYLPQTSTVRQLKKNVMKTIGLQIPIMWLLLRIVFKINIIKHAIRFKNQTSDWLITLAN